MREPSPLRCHLDRLVLDDGIRRLERPLPGWLYYGSFAAGLAYGDTRLLVGGERQAFIVDWATGAVTPFFEEPDGAGVCVAWLDADSPAAAGAQSVVVDGPGGRQRFPCRHAVGLAAVGPELLVVSDDDGSHWIAGGRVVARDWRSILGVKGGVIQTAGGEAFTVELRAAR